MADRGAVSKFTDLVGLSSAPSASANYQPGRGRVYDANGNWTGEWNEHGGQFYDSQGRPISEAENNLNNTRSAMQSGNTMYGRTATGFQDEANRTLAAANQRAAAFGGMGTSALQRGQNLGAGAQEMAYQGQLGAGEQQDRANLYQSNALGTAESLGGMSANERAQAQSNLANLHAFYQQGPGPSAAEAQMRQGADANMAQAIALAHSGRGAGANANAIRSAAFQNAAAGQQLNQQLGVLRANEAANWRGQQLQAMGTEQQGWQGLRGQDIGAQGQQLGFAQGMGQQGLGYGQLGLGYQQTGNQAQLGFEGMGNQTNLGFQNLGNTAAYQGEDLRNKIYSGQQASDVNRYGADKGVQVGMRQADDQRTAMWLGMAGSAIGAMSDVRAKENIQPMSMRGAFGNRMGGGMYGQMPRGMQFNMQSQQMAQPSYGSHSYGIGGYDPSVANASAAQSFLASHPSQPGNGLGLGGSGGGIGGNALGSGSGGGLQGNALVSGASPSGQMANMQDQNAAMMLSDEREKERVKRAAFSAGQQSVQSSGADLRPAQGYSYNYKDPDQYGAGPGRYVGPMAQDLEKTPAGASTVKTGPDGKKIVDAARLTMVNTAAVSELQRRTDELEALLNNRAARAPGEQLPGPTQPASNIGFHQSGATGLEAMQAGPYGLPTQEEADAAAFRRKAFARP